MATVVIPPCPECGAKRVIVRLRRWPWRPAQWWRCYACFTKFQAAGLQVWPLQRVLTEVRCGSSDWPWEDEWADLEAHHADRLTDLETQIKANGLTTPVLIGSDGRLWDGHHRLRIAVRLGIRYVPVEIVAPADGTEQPKEA